MSDTTLFDEQEAAARRQRTHDELVAELAELMGVGPYALLHQLANRCVATLVDRGWTFTPPPF